MPMREWTKCTSGFFSLYLTGYLPTRACSRLLCMFLAAGGCLMEVQWGVGTQGDAARGDASAGGLANWQTGRPRFAPI